MPVTSSGHGTGSNLVVEGMGGTEGPPKSSPTAEPSVSSLGAWVQVRNWPVPAGSHWTSRQLTACRVDTTG